MRHFFSGRAAAALALGGLFLGSCGGGTSTSTPSSTLGTDSAAGKVGGMADSAATSGSTLNGSSPGTSTTGGTMSGSPASTTGTPTTGGTGASGTTNGTGAN